MHICIYSLFKNYMRAIEGMLGQHSLCSSPFSSLEGCRAVDALIVQKFDAICAVVIQQFHYIAQKMPMKVLHVMSDAEIYHLDARGGIQQIGRASCRERV